jgi:hypothetical protein
MEIAIDKFSPGSSGSPVVVLHIDLGLHKTVEFMHYQCVEYKALFVQNALDAI